MPQSKPSTLKDYILWINKSHEANITKKTKTYYESVVSSISTAYYRDRFWQHFVEELKDIEVSYSSDSNGYKLFSYDVAPELLLKPYESFLDKTFRKNCLLNENWPNAPEGGWLLPENWFERIKDIVRMSLTVKYLDGIEFLIDRLSTFFEKQQVMPFEYSMEAREEGYYAAHINTSLEVDIPTLDWTKKKTIVVLEIQVTTQLQEVIKKLLHSYYTSKRSDAKPITQKWQWKYDDDEFVANYLGHILHYVEGMIMDVRKRQPERSK